VDIIQKVAGQELVQEGPANKAAKPPTKTTCEVRDAEYKQNALQQALTTTVRVKDHSENSIDLGSLDKLMSKENVHLKNGRYYEQPQSLSLRSGLVVLPRWQSQEYQQAHPSLLVVSLGWILTSITVQQSVDRSKMIIKE
jgi:hypothetical protein